MQQNGWIALGAASALGLGVLAGSAVTAATAMPLVDSSESVDVAPISNLRGDVKFFAGLGEGRVSVPGSTPQPSTSPGPSSAPTATPAPAPTVTQAPAPQPVPVAPVAPAQSGDSPDSPDFDDD
ncbi:MAG: hypothetical protein Q7T15_04590 [Microcella sp.]|uniref:hypothetical protein n=1 Tax=Microcella sp. TaxID=1913979 RepID=UPI0027237BD3|nr:hypothetical protein [Microcella sp.]MDO8337516.1 hypothetical protein [Microcella sp.]